MKQVLETRQLTLREMGIADLDFVAEMLGDPQVMRFYPKTYDRDESEAWIRKQEERYAGRGCGIWLAVERGTGDPVGQAGVLIVDLDGTEEPALAYLIHRPYWRRGLATDAAAACRDYAFDVLDRPRVVTLIRPENTPSQGVAQKIGMKPERRTLFAGYEHIVFAVQRD
jgi:RimJ/RimL family protein N-acetyltransferase